MDFQPAVFLGKLCPHHSELLHIVIKLFNRVMLMLLGGTELFDQNQDEEIKHNVLDEDDVRDHKRDGP
jgi:hypothetical protein